MKSLLPDFDLRPLSEIGGELHGFAAELFPICRSITGDGLRATLQRISGKIPLSITEVPSGTEVFDWKVPKEWNIRDAWIKDSSARRVVDFNENNLHVLNYSTPVRGTFPLAELKEHLFTLPDRPDWIPYRTSYYKPEWGFCMSYSAMLKMTEPEYEVLIDSTLEDGNLSYGECFLPGKSDEEVLISVHACHPSLANDNLSGLTVAAHLARFLSSRELRYSYRFVFLPGTIGAITWLALNRDTASRIRHGLVLTSIGDAGGFHYKKSRRGSAEIDRAAAHALRHCGEPAEILDFSPYGYDERQYCSPGFNLPVGCLMRSVWGTFPEYHTSADNLEFIRPEALARSLRLLVTIVDILENNQIYLNRNPYCEPQLGKRGLYRSTGGSSIGAEINSRLWVLNQSDGEHSLLEIAERSGILFSEIHSAATLLEDENLLSRVVAETNTVV